MAAKTSRHTPEKQELLKVIARTYLTVQSHVIRRGGWHPVVGLWDLHAGPGRFPDGTPGSPLIFETILHDLNLPHETWFFEANRREVAHLRSALTADRFCADGVIPGNHYQTIHTHVAKLPCITRPRMGLIYSDSNGARIPVEVIRRILDLRGYDRIDVLIHAGARSYKRQRAAGLDPFRYADDLRALGKRHVMIRELGTSQDWTFVVATNWPMPAAFRDFHPITTEQGRCLLTKLDQSERERNPELPFPPIEPMRSISGTRVTAPSVRRSSPGRGASANDANAGA
jgi:hypothetical protein